MYYPMWLSYAAGLLEKNGHEVLLIDAAADENTLEWVIERAAEFKPRLAVLDTSTPSIYNDIEVAKRLKEKIENLFTVLVGVHVSALPGETMQDAPFVDAVAFREYDETLVELALRLQEFEGPADLTPVKGLAFRDGKGEIVINPPRPHIENLDEIPFVSSVYKNHLQIGRYFYGHSRYPLIVIVTGRGCPFHCTFCVVPQTMHGHRYRKRSISNIVEEFQYIARSFPEVKEIMIEDDTLTADRERCRELSEALIKAKATAVPWSANSRADVDYETMRIMKRAGCRLFCVGFESGDQRILDNIKKATKISKIEQFMHDARRAGILIHGCFMVGNRGETRETLETTLCFAKRLNPDTAQFFPIMVYPGTSDYEYFKGKGWIVTSNFREWLTEDGLHSSVVSNPDLTYEYLVEFCNRARREFYLRPLYLASKAFQLIRNPGESRRIIKAARTFLRYLFRKPPKDSCDKR